MSWELRYPIYATLYTGRYHIVTEMHGCLRGDLCYGRSVYYECVVRPGRPRAATRRVGDGQLLDEAGDGLHGTAAEESLENHVGSGGRPVKHGGRRGPVSQATFLVSEPLSAAARTDEPQLKAASAVPCPPEQQGNDSPIPPAGASQKKYWPPVTRIRTVKASDTRATRRERRRRRRSRPSRRTRWTRRRWTRRGRSCGRAR